MSAPDPTKRLTPLTDAEAVARRHENRDAAECPCCTGPTTKGWLFDRGCCYQCASALDDPPRRKPMPARVGKVDPYSILALDVFRPLP